MATTDEPTEQIINDPEEYSQKRRVRELLERRAEVIEARNRAIDEQTLGGVSEMRALRHYQSRIESLIIDLYTKFGNLETESGEDYLTDKHIDSVIIPPPDEILPDSDDDMAPGAEPPEPQTEQIYSLEWFIEREPVVSAEFTTYSWNPPGQQTEMGQRHIPIRTLDKALLNCIEFMDKMGIDADISIDKGDAGFNWEDFAENVPGENNE